MGTLVQQELREGVTKKEFNGIFTKTVDFTDTATPSGLAATDLGSFAMMLKTVRVLFGTPAPNTLTVLIKDKDGHTIVNETITASGPIYLDDDEPLSDGCTLALSGNTIASAKAKITLKGY